MPTITASLALRFSTESVRALLDLATLLTEAKLGAFGFMSSDETMRFGVVNAGLLDQHFALQWVQSYIGLFGGNASQVTISGESAGGGSVMLQAMAFGGYLGDSLFSNVRSNSYHGNWQWLTQLDRSLLRLPTCQLNMVTRISYPRSHTMLLPKPQAASAAFRRTTLTTASSHASLVKTPRRCRTPAPISPDLVSTAHSIFFQ